MAEGRESRLNMLTEKRKPLCPLCAFVAKNRRKLLGKKRT